MLATDKVNGGYENFLSQLFLTIWINILKLLHILNLFLKK